MRVGIPLIPGMLDVVSVLGHRPAFFGGPFGAALQEAMRGPSDWTAGERELFAAFVSAQNQCLFWTGSHGAVASYVLGRELVEAALADWHSAPEPVRSMLGLLRKVTLAPDEVAPEDVEAVRRAGVADQAIVDALRVGALFNVIDRIADALGFVVPTPEAFADAAPAFFERGYA